MVYDPNKWKGNEGGLNQAGAKLKLFDKLKQGISGVESAQGNIGGIEQAVTGLGNAYGAIPGALDQQQNAGIYEMRRLAGQQFASMAGRGGASNVVASAGAGDANAQMAGQIGQFMGDIAAKKAQASIAGAESGLQSQQMLYGVRQEAAAAPVDSAQLQLAMNLPEETATATKESISMTAQAYVLKGDIKGLNDWIMSIQDPIERRAAWVESNKLMQSIWKLSPSKWSDYK